MVRDHLKFVCGFLLIGLALIMPARVFAAPEAQPSTCHAYSAEKVEFSSALGALEWDCGDSGWQDGAAYSWLRWDVRGDIRGLEQFTSRITVYSAVDIAALDADGAIRIVSYGMQDSRPVAAGPVFALPLPSANASTQHYLVRIERPHSVTVATEASIGTRPEESIAARDALIVLGLVAGMLFMPLLFDAMFYLVLRERFVQLHAGLTMAMIAYVLFAGGLITVFVEVPMAWMARIAPLTWAWGSGFGALFMLNFLERDALPQLLRRALLWCALWAVSVPVFASLQLPWTQSFDNQLYFFAMLPILPFDIVVIVTALARGSRAARFLAVAWLPLLLAAGERLLRGMGLYGASDSIDLALFLALGFEVVIVAMGVADRFLAIRRQRDRAITKARTLEELTELDSLTGLLNRRAIEARFARLWEEGFTTLAVIDLDHFKRVNDNHGHAAGDLVLKAVAVALQPDDQDVLAFRMGGEEFLLMLRGRNALAKAEELRVNISDLVGKNAPVAGPLTASMGLVEAAQGAFPETDFTQLYDRADRLLYEAKAAGRDRTMSERVKIFLARRELRRDAMAA